MRLIYIQPLTAIVALHYACPLITLLYYLAATTVSACTLQPLSPKIQDQRLRRDVILWLMLSAICEYVSLQSFRNLQWAMITRRVFCIWRKTSVLTTDQLIQVILILVRMLVQKGYSPSQDETVSSRTMPVRPSRSLIRVIPMTLSLISYLLQDIRFTSFLRVLYGVFSFFL
jgi:hypothetical protein